ncbi:MAG TPA: hypothetical protein VM580_32435, partial [Labilithrix sp.]|nr:hypothetical protein [Labilithrix sp.]
KADSALQFGLQIDLHTFTPVHVGWCGHTRFDLRRAKRKCEKLPGAIVIDKVTYIPGQDGRFRVGRPLAGTKAPSAIKQKTCTYTWEPARCGAVPDTAKLRLEKREQLVPRAPGCNYLGPGGCMIKTPTPTIDGGTPTGLGRCDICGFAADKHLWAVLPATWSSFSYVVGGEHHFVPINSSQEFYDIDLPKKVQSQNVTLYEFNSAP